MTSQLSDGMGSPFAMVPLDPDGPLLTALRDGDLHPRDLAVLWALVARLDWRTGRAWASANDLAAAIGHETPAHAKGSLRRLKRLGLVASGVDRKDSSRVFLCVNPLVAVAGGPNRREWQRRQFEQAVQ